MKRICNYKKFVLCEVTENDVKITGGTDSRYVAGEILCFLADEDRWLGYEEWPATDMNEAKEWIDSYNKDEEIQKKPRLAKKDLDALAR
jgi:hypothetical protein